MDPLSITVSVLAVAGAIKKVCNGLQELIALRDAPDTLSHLNDEVADLRLVMQAIETHPEHQYDAPITAAQDQNFYNALERVKSVTLELDKLVKHTLTKDTSAGIRVDYLRWFWSRKKIKGIVKKVQSSKNQLHLATSLNASAAVERVEYLMTRRHVEYHQMQQDCHNLLTAMLQRSQLALEGSQVLRSSADNTVSLQQALEENAHSKAVEMATGSDTNIRSTNGDGFLNASEHRPLEHQIPTLPYGNARACGSQSSVKLQRQERCKQSCPCPCHCVWKWQSPQVLKNIFGVMNVDYNGLHGAPCACIPNRIYGTAATTRIRYTFPRWIFCREVFMALTVKMGPELLLRFPRIRPYNSPIFKVAEKGDISYMKQLLTSGEASLFDTGPLGESLLQIIVQHASNFLERRELIQMLIQLGADPFQEDKAFDSAYRHCWSQVFRNLVSEPESEWISSTFDQDDSIEQFGFSELHLAVLDFKTTELFEMQLRQIPKTVIDEQDRQGKTALLWASSTENELIVTRLLQREADPNKVDLCGMTSLHWAAIRDNTQVLKCLIDAKAGLNVQNVHGETAIFKAIRFCNPGSVRSLLDHGADHSTTDEHGRNLLHQACYGNLSTLAVLRQAALRGLDIHSRDNAGLTPIECARIERESKAQAVRDGTKPRGEDPTEWFSAFQDLVDSIGEQTRREIPWTSIGSGVLYEEEDVDHTIPGSFPGC